MSSGRRRRLLFGDFKEQLVSEDFSREVLRSLVGRELLSPEWAERLLSRRHTGFSVHSRVRAKTKTEVERVGQYMIRPLLSLERLSFLEPEGKVSYRYGQGGAFRVKTFLDDYFARGIIPASLIRWEMTGLDDEMKILLSVDGRKPHKR